ncbi:MAG: peptide chain release factor N(5)-glutamine methyltransferase [Rhodospirillales bacterium]|nr:peptide chain release factor N(5)-glutamine methyltransferase [Rhodospirillales bacterium]
MNAAPAGDAGAVTVGDALRGAGARLRAGGIEAPPLEARLLVAAALAEPAERLIARPERDMPAAAAVRLEEFLGRRLAHEPMAYILGQREFWSLPFAVTPATLIPRPDSETVVAAALAAVPDRRRALRVLDLGTGSGCLLLALLAELPAAEGVGIDIDPAALAIAEANARGLGFAARARWAHDDWGRGLDERFDLIVSNPPYIPDAAIDTLAPDVRDYEPRRALSGGADGLGAYRALAPHAARLLAPAGIVAVEIGLGQASAVEAILVGAGLVPAGRRLDLAGIERCIWAGWPAPSTPAMGQKNNLE